MKQLTFAILVLLTLTASAKPRKAKAPASAPTPAASTEAVQTFSELRLRAKLKRPELSYDFEDSDRALDVVQSLPTDFNEALLESINEP